MVWRNYYRPKQNDPYSLTALERLSKKALEEKKTFYEKTIADIEKKFNYEEYKKRLNKIPYKLLLDKNKEIDKKFQIISKKNIIIKVKYYALVSFFGSFKEGRIVANVLCDLNNEIKEFLKDFKQYIELVLKYNKISESNSNFNEAISAYVNSLIEKSRIKNISKMYNQDINYIGQKLSGYDILNNIPLRLVIGYGFGSSIDVMKVSNGTQKDNEVYPRKKIKDEYWSKAIECSEDDFRKIDGTSPYNVPDEQKDFRFVKKDLYICGPFFKEIFKISKNISEFYLYDAHSEETFLEYRDKLLQFYNSYLRKIILINRSKKRQETIAENFNNIYVLSNKSYEGVFKVGWTSNLPEERAEQLSSETGVLYPFKVIYSREFQNAEKIEKKIHKKFKTSRLRNNKEFFKIDKNKLIEYIESIDT